MKNLKKFERFTKRDNNLIINKPAVGDLVVGFITARKNWNLDLKYFLNNTVAEVSYASYDSYVLKYDAIPVGFEDYFTKFSSDDYYTRQFQPFDVRFATPQEKREFLLKKERDKYNL